MRGCGIVDCWTLGFEFTVRAGCYASYLCLAFSFLVVG